MTHYFKSHMEGQAEISLNCFYILLRYLPDERKHDKGERQSSTANHTESRACVNVATSNPSILILYKHVAVELWMFLG